MYNIEKIRKDFPIFQQLINGKPNTFLDSAASSQKPKVVIDKILDVYSNYYANVHRGSYFLSEKITSEYEEARQTVQKFINASSEKEIVFVRGATEGINLVASTWGRKNLKPGDEVLLSEAEHHANLVPWQALRDEIGFTLKFFKLNEDGSFSLDNYNQALSKKTKFVSVTAMSNVLGTIFPIREMVKAAHKVGAKILIDACQYVVHKKTDVKYFDCDFLVFSGHKLYGPTGVGVLYGKYDELDSMPPYQYGGDMVDSVRYETTIYELPPARFEAGTPAIVEVLGLAEAIKYVENIGIDNIEAYENELIEYMRERLLTVQDLVHIGNVADKGGVFSFNIEGIHSQDLAFILDKEGVSVRTGHHCAEPLVKRFGQNSFVRASLGLYSTKEDIDRFIDALNKAKTFF